MADFLGVTDVFWITGRGVVATVSLAAAEGWPIAVGDTATFERPDGSTFRTTIMGVAVPRSLPPNAHLAMLLGREITSKDMVPAGAKLLSVERQSPGATQ